MLKTKLFKEYEKRNMFSGGYLFGKALGNKNSRKTSNQTPSTNERQKISVNPSTLSYTIPFKFGQSPLLTTENMSDMENMNVETAEQAIENNEQKNNEFSASASSNAFEESTTNMSSTIKNVESTQPISVKLNSLASMQLAAGFLQIFEPPLVKVHGQLKELNGKQNKIYIDLSAEKFKLDNAEIAQLQEMMNDIKVYREKLLKIKKQMQQIYQRTKHLKKRAINIEAYKQKELQRKLRKQQQEESLIGNK